MQYKCLTEYNELIDNPEEDYLLTSVPESPVIEETYFRYDFNNGFRIQFTSFECEYFIIIRDLYSKYVYYKEQICPEQETVYTYIKKYRIDYEVLLFKVSHNVPEVYPFKVIQYDLTNKNVLMYVSGSEEKCGLGDTIASLQSVAKFHDVYPNTNIYVVTSYPEVDEILKICCPWMNILSYYEAKEMNIFYATYQHGCFFSDINKHHNPIDYRQQSLIDFGYNVLNVKNDCIEKAYLKFNVENEIKRQKPYVCIGVRASCVSKEWIPNEHEFERLIDFLECLGYDVIFIDINKNHHMNNLISSKNPDKGIHMEGKISLIERLRLLQGCDCFVGVSSGLSWLAWACDVPVVMISGFTNPITEFKTPYRVINYVKCNSCWNDMTIDNYNAYGCPRKKGAFNNEFMECSFSITSDMVIQTILKIDKVKERYDMLFNKK
jgi:autotransporter strand-loop-strand O-heptosyltransferase